MHDPIQGALDKRTYVLFFNSDEFVNEKDESEVMTWGEMNEGDRGFDEEVLNAVNQLSVDEVLYQWFITFSVRVWRVK